MKLKHIKNNKVSIFDKIMTCFIGIFLVFLLVGIIFSVIIDNFMEEKVLGDREMLLTEAINSCEYILKENSDILLSLTEDETIRYILREYDRLNVMERFEAEKEITRISEGFIVMRPEIAQIKIFKEGIFDEIMVNDSIYDIEEMKKDELYKNVVGLRASIVPEYTLMEEKGKNSGRMAIVSQIIDYNNDVLGYMCIEIDKSILYKRCVSSTLMVNKYIIDENGTPIITPGNDRNVLYSDIINGFNKTGKFVYNDDRIDGKKCIVLASPTNGHGWRIVNIEEQSDFYNWRTNFIIAIIGIFIVLILLFAAIAYKLSDSLSKPIIRLSESMGTSKRAEESREFKEITILQNKYNDLLELQKLHIRELEQYSAKQREAEIKSMIAQINPHFVFNTLTSIAYKALEDEQAELCTMIGKLGKLCKISYNLQSFLTTVEEEIMYVSLYMDLQKLCFDDKFSYDIIIGDDAGKVRMPRFVIQPFVENSIVHGFSGIKYKGHIKIKVSLKDEKLIINITDNGCGIEENIIEKLNRNAYNTEKYGVRNVRERIEHLCGIGYGVRYINKNRNGTDVVITLPGRGDDCAYNSDN